MNSVTLSRIKNYLLDGYGLKYSAVQEDRLTKRLERVVAGLPFPTMEAFADWLVQAEDDHEWMRLLIAELTIGETYFFRDNDVYHYLEHDFFPALISKRRNTTRNLRIWSAGCATGEEPYSIAMLLKKLLPSTKGWQISILATDINTQFLKRARKGEYSEWSFRNAGEDIKSAFFTTNGKGRYTIDRSVAEMVHFQYLNLAAGNYPDLITGTNAMDLILCRNVFIYFSSAEIRRATERLYNALVNKGVLITSPVENTPDIYAGFTRLKAHNRTFFVHDKHHLKDRKAEVQHHDQWVETFLSIYPEESNLELPTDLLPVEQWSEEAAVSESPPAEDNHEFIEETESPIEPTPYEVGISMFRRGEFENASKIFEKLYGNGERQSDLLHYWIRSESNRGNLKEALSLCDRQTLDDRLDTDCYFLQAQIRMELGDTDGAVKSLNKVIFLNPDHILAHFFHGNLFRDMDKKAEGRRSFRNALRLLKKMSKEDIIEGSEGVTAAEMEDVIEMNLQSITND